MQMTRAAEFQAEREIVTSALLICFLYTPSRLLPFWLLPVFYIRPPGLMNELLEKLDSKGIRLQPSDGEQDGEEDL